MKVLVTGGSGFLGTHIRRSFDADDLSRRAGLDILNVQDVKMAREYDVIIHLAAELDKSPDNAESVFRTNVEGTINLLREVKQDAVFIFASTKDVYGRFADNFATVPEACPTNYSGQSALEWSKLIAERHVEYYANQRGFRSCIFRLATVYAPPSEGNVSNYVGHYVDAINKGEPLALPAKGLPTRDLLHVNDLASACQAFVDSIIRHGLYNLGGGPRNSLTLRETVAKLEQVSGYQAIINEDAEVSAPAPMNYITNLSLVTQELDWSPKIGLDAGLKSLF